MLQLVFLEKYLLLPALHHNPRLEEVVECAEEARPKMSAGVSAHEYRDSPVQTSFVWHAPVVRGTTL